MGLIGWNNTEKVSMIIYIKHIKKFSILFNDKRRIFVSIIFYDKQ